VILTEWLCYRRPDWDRLAEGLRRRLIFDGRNLFDPRQARERGFEYYPIGREQIHPVSTLADCSNRVHAGDAMTDLPRRDRRQRP
jgi:hypothetical protein